MKMKRFYAFYAVLEPYSDGYGIRFPDLPGTVSSGETVADAIANARECLALYLHGMAKGGDPIPLPSKQEQIEFQEETLLELVSVDMREFYPEEFPCEDDSLKEETCDKLSDTTSFDRVSMVDDPQRLSEPPENFSQNGDDVCYPNGDPKYQWIEFKWETPFGIIDASSANTDVDREAVDEFYREKLLKEELLDRKRLQYKDEIERFNYGDWNQELKTIEDVVIVLLYGREFEVKYKEYTALITTSFVPGFSVFSTRHGEQEEEFEFSADDPDDFAENATLGPYLLKNIVGKWEITWHA